MTKKKKIFLTVLLGVLGLVAIIIISYFIIRQLDIHTAFFYNSYPATGETFDSISELIEYEQSGGKFIYSTAKSVIASVVILITLLIYEYFVIKYFILLLKNKNK